MHVKDFSAWITLKQSIDAEKNRPGEVRQGEIRWCAIGHNIGNEIDGKGTLFARPALILRQLSPNTCFVVPLTHSSKTGHFIYQFEFRGEVVKARLDQARVVDIKRINAKLGELSDTKFKDIAEHAKAFLFWRRRKLSQFEVTFDNCRLSCRQSDIVRHGRSATSCYSIFMLYTSLRDFLGSVTTNDRTPIDPVEIVVIDGDTIQLGGVTCRLLGFDAPETYHARCSHELVHGLKATNKLRRMINDGCSHALSITRHRDKYKRSLATLYLDGIDVAQVMTGPAMPPAPITTLPQLGPSSPPKLREWLMW